MRPGVLVLSLVACTRPPATAPSATREPVIEPVPEDSGRPAAATPALAVVSDPIAALRARLPERRGWDGEPVEPDTGSMWHELGDLLNAAEPGPARDELLRIGAATPSSTAASGT